MRQWQPMIIEMSSRREMIDIVIAHRHLYCDHHHQHHHHCSAKLTDWCDAAPEPGRQRQHPVHIHVRIGVDRIAAKSKFLSANKI